jgi:hypothetical protein
MGITWELYHGFGLGIEFMEKTPKEDLDESVIVITIGFARMVIWLND